MSDTPRTDVYLKRNIALGWGSMVVVPKDYPPCDPWELARELEKENKILKRKLKMPKNVTVLYHADNGGFGAAYALWTRFKDNATYIPVQYGQPVPEIPEDTDRLFIVDFSYSREICEDLHKKYAQLVILDHHKTAEKALTGLPFVNFDQNKSGCALAWDWTMHDVMPDILRYVQDYDLWKFELPFSKEINLFISTLPWDFEIWHLYATQYDFVECAKAAGSAIKAFRDAQVEYALKNVRIMFLTVGETEYEIPCVNASANISEIGNVLCKHYPNNPFSISYCDRKDVRTWSLRSVGDFDVSEIAKAFGGGGHKNAAGFVTDIGWPQRTPDEFIKAFKKESK